MFKVILILTITISFVFQSVAQCQTPSDLTEPFDLLAYQKTIALCYQINNTQDEEYVSWGMLKFAGTGFKSGASLWGKDILQLSDATQQLIRSRGYQAALNQCYGDDQISHKAFTAAIICADAGGHILGWVAWMIPMSFFAKLFAASKWALAHPAMMEVGGWVIGGVQKVSLAAITAYMGWDLYHDHEIRKNSYTYLEQYNDRMVDATREEADETYVLVQKELVRVNTELASGASDPAREKYLLEKKALLEERLNTRNAPPTVEPISNIGPK